MSRYLSRMPWLPMTKARMSGGVKVAERPLGLPDDAFAQKRPLRGLITKSEVRAVSLYKLGLRRDSTVWDIGAGSGSVALEAAIIASEGTVYAVERDEECLDMLRRNVAELGPRNVVVVDGEAPDALADLPAPDSVFVGGSGGKLAEILKCVAIAYQGAWSHRGESGRDGARDTGASVP